MKSLCIFCGSSNGNKPIYTSIAQQVGQHLSSHQIRLVYGSGSTGLMQHVADSVLENGGEVVGVIPRFFDYDLVGHKSITQIIVVDSMAERKTQMLAMSDAFLTLPGGYGTLDEFFEMLTLLQLEQHTKPIWILNINGFYDCLIQQLNYMQQEGFISAQHRAMFTEIHSVDEIFAHIVK